MERFIEICKKSQKQLRKYCRKELLNLGYEVKAEEKYLYAPGEIPVLLVAHMDTVHRETCKIACVSKEGIIMSPEGIGGDDRCGVYMILEIVKKMKCHVLFTEDEECGGIGAGKFAHSKYINDIDVNFIIEFDRMGYNDAVYYDLDNQEFEDFISSFGWFKTSYGSYSDICDVAPAIGVAAVNLSCGYFNAHTTHEYVDYYVMLNNIAEAKKIISAAEKRFEWNECVRYYPYYKGGKSNSLHEETGYEYLDYYGRLYYGDYDEELKELVIVDDSNIKSKRSNDDVFEGYYGFDEDGKVYEIDIETSIGYYREEYVVDGVLFDEFDAYTVLCLF